ncbi:hypothetical protein, variant [Saprolegnia diclina VS20]|uniref:FYVE-type domain-containing protein n=1 Tax=Saprolegnia diclina (strain VS20) TaxID=1156394 RepID=T0PWT7_SAPDV|nr:hypothetical protein, variant [Saprolegnia diclina VS20]XP_008619845.1 hypothetical protein SDRG_15450 [Saprolegnia diclina VS20]EQC26720.1 hypothetical protein SDRG_15450 [Saprolegnia diclina VS20]EQC26721.1 hypothetical protein, variant [Saprolegnia diclina VS20]|eukprot:XP_008619844.1 hypothetical protein, variant [Saprolegnia diclina VS20]
MQWFDRWRRSSLSSSLGPRSTLSLHKQAPPASIFCFPHDVRTLSDADLVAHGDLLARRFLRLCGSTKHMQHSGHRPVVAKYDKAAHLYTVHAVVEVEHSSVNEIIELLAGDMDPSTAHHGFNVFMARVFGADLVATTDVRRCAPTEPTTSDDDDDSDDVLSDDVHDAATSTLARLARAGVDGCASVKQSVFAHHGLFTKRQSEWLVLDYAKQLSDKSFVRVFKSVDNNVSHPTLERKGHKKTRVMTRHKHLLFGFHVEEVQGVCRITFHASHFSLHAQKETQMYLERMAGSLSGMPSLLFRRRLGRRLTTRRLKIPELTRSCAGCNALLGARKSVCRLCNEYYCFDCTSVQRAETAVHVPLLELRVCHDCVQRAKDGSDVDFTTDHVDLAPFINSGCHDPAWLFAISDRAMFRISEGTSDGASTPTWPDP